MTLSSGASSSVCRGALFVNVDAEVKRHCVPAASPKFYLIPCGEILPAFFVTERLNTHVFLGLEVKYASHRAPILRSPTTIPAVFDCVTGGANPPSSELGR